MTGGSEVGVKSWIWTSTQIGVRLVPGPGGQTLGILYKALDFVKVEPCCFVFSLAQAYPSES